MQLGRYRKWVPHELTKDNLMQRATTRFENHQGKIEGVPMGILPHPPYSPELAPSDYHLFRSLENHLAEKTFEDEEGLKNDLAAYFAHKSADFSARGIRKLPERWKEDN